MARACGLVVLTLALTAPVAADVGSVAVQDRAAAVVYVQLAVKILPEYFPKLETLTLFEVKVHQKILDEYLPLQEASGFFMDDRGHVVTTRQVVSPKDLVQLQQTATSAYSSWIQSVLGTAAVPPDDLRKLKVALYKAFTSGPLSLRARVRDAQFYEAKLVAVDDALDLALLSVEAPATEFVLLGSDKDLAVGKEVYSLGYPFGRSAARPISELSLALTTGLLTAVRAESPRLHHTASINAGSSGGPLFNASGVVLGMNTVGLLDTNNSYSAIAASSIRNFLQANGVAIPSVLPSYQRAEVATGDYLRKNGQGEYEVSDDLLFNQPSDHSIFLDGVMAGYPPLLVEAPADAFTVRIEGPLSFAEGKFRTLESLSGSTEVRLPMVPFQGTLTLASTPPGTVTVDGQVRAASEFPLTLNAGVHKVQVRAKGLFFRPQAVTIGRNQAVAVETSGVPAYLIDVTGVPQRPTLRATQQDLDLSFPPQDPLELSEGVWNLSWPETTTVRAGSVTVTVRSGASLNLSAFRLSGSPNLR